MYNYKIIGTKIWYYNKNLTLILIYFCNLLIKVKFFRDIIHFYIYVLCTVGKLSIKNNNYVKRNLIFPIEKILLILHFCRFIVMFLY